MRRASSEQWRRPAGPPSTPGADERRQGDEEQDLQDVAHALARAEGMDDVLRRIATSALHAGDADGVYVERVDLPQQLVTISAGAGWGYPPIGTRVPYPGSLAEEVLEKGEPEFIEDLAAENRPISRHLRESCECCKGLVLPLVSESQALGALVLMRRPQHPDFDPAHAGTLRMLADLAALSLRRHILHEEVESRERLLRESETERKHAEAERETALERERASTEALTQILESITDAFYALDREWRFTYANSQAESLLQRSRAELLGRNVWELYPAAVGAGFWGEFHQAMQEGSPAHFEEFYEPLGIWLEVHAYPSKAGLAVYFRDVTQRKRAEEALELERRRLHATLAAIPVGVFISDAAGRLLEINHAAQDIWEGSAPLLESPSEYGQYKAFWPGTHAPVKSQEWGLARALSTGRPVLGEEMEIETFAGRRRTVLNYALPVRDEEGRIFGGVAVNVDISEQKRAEESQRFLAQAGRVLGSSLEYRQTLRQVANLAVPRIADWCAVYLASDTGRIEYTELAHVDPAKVELVRELQRRYPPDPNAPAGAYKVLRTGEPDFLPEISDELLQAVARDADHLRILRELGLTSVITVPMIARSRRVGAISLVAAQNSRRFTAADLEFAQELANRAAVAVDNSRLFDEADRRANEEAALRRAAHAVTATYSVSEIIQQIAISALEATDADGSFVGQVNGGANEVVVTATSGQLAPEPGSREPFPGSFTEAVIGSHEPLLIERLVEVERQLPGDLARNCAGCSAIILPLLDGGETVGSLSLLRRAERAPFREDEIARARTFADLAALAFRKVHLLEDSELRREELESVIESRARLMRGFGHDLRNPLGAADGFAALLEEGVLGELPPRALESVARLRGAIRRALALIDDLVELARVEAGQVRIEATAVDLRDVAREMVEEYRVQADSAGHDLHLTLPAEFPRVQSDSSRIRQILENLLSNAIKYTPAGGRIDVRVVERSLPGGRHTALVRVSDTGRGIPPGETENIFREFSRLHAHAAEGAGIGLAISRRLARILGGDILVASELGQGSTFTLCLPVR